MTRSFFKRYGGRVSELEAEYILFLLFGMGGLAVWSGSEAVLPAYIIGMVLGGSVGKDLIPTVQWFEHRGRAGMYYSLVMSTGLMPKHLLPKKDGEIVAIGLEEVPENL